MSRPHRDVRGGNAVEEDREGPRIRVRLWPPWRARSTDCTIGLLVDSVEILSMLEREDDDTDVITRSTLGSRFRLVFSVGPPLSIITCMFALLAQTTSLMRNSLSLLCSTKFTSDLAGVTVMSRTACVESVVRSLHPILAVTASRRFWPDVEPVIGAESRSRERDGSVFLCSEGPHIAESKDGRNGDRPSRSRNSPACWMVLC
jgi:hypothetical protein